MKCTKCDHINPAANRFCINCGAPLSGGGEITSEKHLPVCPPKKKGAEAFEVWCKRGTYLRTYDSKVEKQVLLEHFEAHPENGVPLPQELAFRYFNTLLSALKPARILTRNELEKLQEVRFCSALSLENTYTSLCTELISIVGNENEGVIEKLRNNKFKSGLNYLEALYQYLAVLHVLEKGNGALKEFIPRLKYCSYLSPLLLSLSSAVGLEDCVLHSFSECGRITPFDCPASYISAPADVPKELIKHSFKTFFDGKYSEAIEMFQQLIPITGHAFCSYIIGKAYHRMKRNEEAASMWHLALFSDKSGYVVLNVNYFSSRRQLHFPIQLCSLLWLFFLFLETE